MKDQPTIGQAIYLIRSDYFNTIDGSYEQFVMPLNVFILFVQYYIYNCQVPWLIPDIQGKGRIPDP